MQATKKAIVGSKNPVKIEAVRRGLAAMFPDTPFEVEGVSVPSGVSDQPQSEAETRQGAYNRAENARAAYPDAAFWMGLEGGIEDSEEIITSFAWIVVLSSNRAGQSRTASFILPDEVADLVREGLELGDADDIVFKQKNSKQKGGAVGILTDGAVNRADYYATAVSLALIPFKNTELNFLPPHASQR